MSWWKVPIQAPSRASPVASGGTISASTITARTFCLSSAAARSVKVTAMIRPTGSSLTRAAA